MFDLIIIGAGPAGLSAAYAAKQQGLDYLVLERAQIATTIQNYPLGKLLFSTPNELEFEPDTLKPAGNKPTREEVLDYYQRFADQDQQLRIHTNEPVIEIIPSLTPDAPLVVKTNQASYQGRAVLVAVGGMGIINRLNVPGETPERVSYFFHTATPYRNKPVIVVGGGNSAAETVLDLVAAEAMPTLLLRRPSLERVSGGAGIKPWVQQPLEAAVAAGKAQIFFNARVLEVLKDQVKIDTDGQELLLPCDHIFALIGARPDVSLLANAGVLIAPDGRPQYDLGTYQTNVGNLYVVGHLTRELHMKNATSLPPKIVAQIAQKLHSRV